MAQTVYDERGNQLILSDRLGEGAQGAVFRVSKDTGRGLAVKALLDRTTGDVLQDPKMYKKYSRKINAVMALPQIKHVTLPLTLLREPYCGYVMRLMEGMVPFVRYLIPDHDIVDALKKSGGLLKRMRVLQKLAAILCDLHTHGVIYGDLSPGNIYVSALASDSEVWLIDLDNLAYASEVTSAIGTPCYRAPEVVAGLPNTFASDCYSFALLAYEYLTFSKPFAGTAAEEVQEDDFGDAVFEKIESGEMSYVHEQECNNQPLYGFSKDINLVMTPELAQLFLQTFGYVGRTDPSRRPSMRAWLRALERACNLLACCEQGHMHFGCTCFMCSEQEMKNSHVSYFSLCIYQKKRVFLDCDDENEENKGQLSLHELIYKKRFTIDKKAKKDTVIPIPWKVLDPLGRTHSPNAFELRIKKDECLVERVFDPNMCVSLKKSAVWKEKNGLRFTVAYRDFEFDFEMKKDD